MQGLLVSIICMRRSILPHCLSTTLYLVRSRVGRAKRGREPVKRRVTRASTHLVTVDIPWGGEAWTYRSSHFRATAPRLCSLVSCWTAAVPVTERASLFRGAQIARAGRTIDSS